MGIVGPNTGHIIVNRGEHLGGRQVQAVDADPEAGERSGNCATQCQQRAEIKGPLAIDLVVDDKDAIRTIVAGDLGIAQRLFSCDGVNDRQKNVLAGKLLTQFAHSRVL